MTDGMLTEELARHVMGWTVTPDRFLMQNRHWMPRWRFRPTERLENAFHLLEAAEPTEYSMGCSGHGRFWVRVRIAGITAEARDNSKARAITLAVARAVGVEAADAK